MDKKTKIHIVISILLVALIALLAYWAQLPADVLRNAQAQIVDTDTVLVRIQDFAFDPDVVRIEPGSTVSWLHDESEGNAGVQHTVTSLDPEDPALSGDLFDSGLMSLGETFSFTFNEEGVFNYNCTLHPFMTGKVCVGAASEILDSDCAIDLTAVEGAVTVEEEEAVAEEELAEEAEVPEGLEEAPEGLEEEAAEEELLPASDEDFEVGEAEPTFPPTEQPPAFPPTEQPPTVPPTEQPSTLTTTEFPPVVPTGDQIPDAGPEDIVYLFIAGFALFVARRIQRYSSN